MGYFWAILLTAAVIARMLVISSMAPGLGEDITGEAPADGCSGEGWGLVGVKEPAPSGACNLGGGVMGIAM